MKAYQIKLENKVKGKIKGKWFLQENKYVKCKNFKACLEYSNMNKAFYWSSPKILNQYDHCVKLYNVNITIETEKYFLSINTF